MKCWKTITFGAVCLCCIGMLTGCGNRAENTQTEKNPSTLQTDERMENTTDRLEKEDNLTENNKETRADSLENGMVNDVTDGDAADGDATDDNGTNLGDAGADVIDGIGDAGKDIINGVEQAGDELTGNGGAAANPAK